MVYLLRRNIKIKRPSNKLDYTKLEPFRIKVKHGPVTYRLEMLEGIRIHPVFHVSLLEKALKGAKLGPVEINEETQKLRYKVDKVEGRKVVGNKTFYLIH
jgi:hypothetical protein